MTLNSHQQTHSVLKPHFRPQELGLPISAWDTHSNSGGSGGGEEAGRRGGGWEEGRRLGGGKETSSWGPWSREEAVEGSFSSGAQGQGPVPLPISASSGTKTSVPAAVRAGGPSRPGGWTWSSVLLSQPLRPARLGSEQRCRVRGQTMSSASRWDPLGPGALAPPAPRHKHLLDSVRGG